MLEINRLTRSLTSFIARLAAAAGAISLIIAASPGCGRSSSSEDGAGDTPAESVSGEVVMYCSVDQQYAEEIIAEFEAAHPGVDVRPRFDTETTKTTGLVQRLRAEQSNPQADLFWSSEVFLTIQLANEGLLRRYESEAARDWPTAYRDSERRWYAFAGRARVIAYDPTRSDDPPMTWRELADERYAGRVTMADPVFGTTRGHVAAWYALWGRDEAESYLRALVENDLRVVASNSQTVREVVQGSAEYGLTDTDDVWAAQRNGHNLAVVYPRHGDGPNQGTLLIPNTLAFIKGRPESEAVRVFADYLLSAETERLLYESDSHNLPMVHTEIEIDERYRVEDPLQINYEKVAAEMKDAIDSAVRILKGQ